ncbi:sphingomyelin phosphodiesterase, putative [Entamoeba invadens IP1]|uniref:Sphingomyelin phosphodiesterase, putative n=2 Tax=Entamoeba invadens TaxID=33085 RepID=A0A0A1U4U9_ENTIV|nr:sphingomyelin phosphodiesterase, putative [Entamoeba invadens IP1]ELP89271.1 sphingomyelin phosphodiesterase, putative [Entamoeba invadens IP1]BAN40851.1 sphingomyelin phosphodiesterase, putative [Entamoeba invadens]|eukprot:XP_004256042.1 sphingomyelin phosphodiesterase, putative [Entamoeba invadens IP1]
MFFLLLLVCDATQLRMLHLSDVHYNNAFNVDYKSSWCQSPTLTPLLDNENYKYGMYNCNPPIDLIDALFEHAKENGPYTHIILSGDVCSHELNDTLFQECNTIMQQKLSEYFGDTPIIFSMGNNDTPLPKISICDDPYFEYLSTTYPTFIPNDQIDNWKKMGSYVVTVGNKTFISFNTNLLTSAASSDCGMLDWMENQLLNYSSENVILVGHIPPGVASHNAADHFDQTQQTKLFEILKRHKDMINSMLLGHVHRDEFRLLPSEDPIVMSVGSGASPVYSNNPGYRIILSDSNRKEGYDDIISYTFNLEAANIAKAPVWMKEASFIKDFEVKDISVEQLTLARNKIYDDLLLGSFYRFRTVGFYDTNKAQILCAIEAESTEMMLQCTKAEKCKGLNY